MTMTLYRLYDREGGLLYVGITDNYARRMVQHSDKAWWAEVVDAKIETHETREDAVQAESRAIAEEAPRYNRAGAAGRRVGVAPVPSVQVPGWVTILEAAEMMRVNPRTIRNRIAKGDIEARRFGPRLIRVNASSLMSKARPLGNWSP